MPLERKINFEKVYEYSEKGAIGKEEFTSFFDRMPILEKALRETELASGFRYPPVLFEPALTVIRYPSSEFASAVVYAATKIMAFEGNLQPCVVFAVPFVIYAREETLRACVAHEFLHYVYITRALSRGEYVDLASERLDSIEVHQAYDDTHTVMPEEWLNNPELVALIKRTFTPAISDPELEAALKEKWFDKGLPVRYATAEEAKVRIPISEVSSIRLDSALVAKFKR